LFELLVQRADRHIEDHVRLFRTVFAERDPESMISKYHELNPLPLDAFEALTASVKRNAPPVESIKCLLVLCSGFGSAEKRCFSCADFTEELGVTEDALASALSKLSLSFG